MASRGNVLSDLLAEFGSSPSPSRSRQKAPVQTRLPSRTASKHLDDPDPEESPIAQHVKAATKSTNKPPQLDSSGSEDELAAGYSLDPQKASAVLTQSQELTMEARRRNRKDGTRRIGRDRHSKILESDTMPLPQRSRRNPPPPPKLDTARARLRYEIANRSKAKAKDFLVAYKDYFLPLLPPTNTVTKLVTNHDAEPIVEYEELAEQPQGVTAVMKPYQLSGLSYLVYLHNNGFSGILGDEMGLGKTLQTLSLFQYLEESDLKKGLTSEEQRPYLVICPLSVLNSWVMEAQKWVPGLRVLRFHGGTKERAHLKQVAMGMEDMRGNVTKRARDRQASRVSGQKMSRLTTGNTSDSFKIIVTTYDTFQAEQSWFKRSFLWRYVVLDEGHKIKNGVSQVSKALRNVSSEFRLLLTGTPLHNNLYEMWSLLAWLYPDVFVDGTDTLFKDAFDLSRAKSDKQVMASSKRLLELIMLRREKTSPGVNLGLPPKEEVLLYVPLTPMQRFWYTRILTRMDDVMLSELFADGRTKEKQAMEIDAQENKLLSKLESREEDVQHEAWEETEKITRDASVKGGGAWNKLMNLVMQLRKCSSHPYLIPGAAPDPYYLSNHIIHASGKFIVLEKLLRQTVLNQDKKVLIFSGFTKTLDLCEDLLSLVSNHGTHFRHLRLDGSTARARRNLDIRLFNQSGSDYKVMLLSTRAGGLGINLTSAQDVMFLDEDWNPQITLQAEARAHRIGQTKPVTIYKLCTQGTVEEQMLSRIRKKLYLSAKVMESMTNVHSQKSSTKTTEETSMQDDMAQLGTSQLKTLIRRGAQTLSHPEIDPKEMASWDFDTMLEECRDKPADFLAAGPGPGPIDVKTDEETEEKWLSVMERVECSVLDGKRYHRQLDKEKGKGKMSLANVLPDSISRADRRKGKNTTVMVDGYAINKESLGCADWEAVPTMAGKDPRLAEPVREKRAAINHELHCLKCFEEGGKGEGKHKGKSEGRGKAKSKGEGQIAECKSCPRTYHYRCLDPVYQAKASTSLGGFHCPQHTCINCGKATSDAGGLIYRCRWCPRGYCEDCLDFESSELISEQLPEFELLGETVKPGGFYIKCHMCIEDFEEHPEQKEWVRRMELDYKEDHEAWIQRTMANQQQLGQEYADGNDNGLTAYTMDVPSPPALTDTSLATPALTDSRVGTPGFMELPTQAHLSKKRSQTLTESNREDKRARITIELD